MANCSDCGKHLSHIEYVEPLTKEQAMEFRNHSPLDLDYPEQKPLCKECWEKQYKSIYGMTKQTCYLL